MNITADTTWLDTVLLLARIHEEGPAERFTSSMADLRNVVREAAVATKQFSYLRFEANSDSQMKLSEIAAVFTKDDYEEMINDIICSPTLMMSNFLREVKSNSQIDEATKSPELVEKFMRAGMKALIIEIGENPAPELEDVEIEQDRRRPAP